VKDKSIRALVLLCILLSCAACEPRLQPVLPVRMLCPVGRGPGDLSIVDEVTKGISLAWMQTSITVEFAVPESPDDARRLLESWALMPKERRAALVIALGHEHEALVDSLQCQFGYNQILFLDGSPSSCPGLMTAEIRTFGSSFLAGVAAMEASERKTAAAIGGMSTAHVDESIEGFVAGVEYAGGRITAREYLAQDSTGFASEPLAFQRAAELFEEADVIISVAGASSLGVIEAALGFAEEDRRYVIGLDADQSVHGVRVVIGSVTTNMKRLTTDTILAASKKEMGSGALTLDLENGGSDFLINMLFESQLRAVVEEARSAAQAAEQARTP